MMSSHAIYGLSSYGEQIIPSLEGYGSVNIQGTTIINCLKVTGILYGSNANLNKIEIQGTIHLTNSIIKGCVSVQGSLTAIGCRFSELISISTDCSMFENSIIKKKILVLPSDGNKKQKIILLGNSEIHGDIEFKKDQGVVEISPLAKIFGRIINGSIEQKR